MLTPGPSVRGWGARCRLLGSELRDVEARAMGSGLRAAEGLLGEYGPVGELGLEKEPRQLPSRLPGLEEPDEEAARDLAELRASRAYMVQNAVR